MATGAMASALMNCSDDNGGKHERDDVYEKTDYMHIMIGNDC